MFENIEPVGSLTINRVIFETTYPILFTCTNEKKELFLCVCCRHDSTERKWLIAKTDPTTMISMLKDELAVRDAFLKHPEVRLTVRCLNTDGILQVTQDDGQDWNEQTSKSLPDAGEYLNADRDEFEEEIAYFEAMAANNPITLNQLEKIKKNIQSISSGMEMAGYLDGIQTAAHLWCKENTPDEVYYMTPGKPEVSIYGMASYLESIVEKI
jgi:hypothetical protein